MNRKRIVIIAVVLLAVATAVAWYSMSGRPDPSNGLTASGTVEATEARLGFQTAGTIAEILVREGDRVAAGQLLARLDTSELEARMEQARARLTAAEAQLRELEGGFRPEEIGQAEAAVQAARERLQDAQSDAARTRLLFDGGAVSPEANQKSQTAVDVARAQLEQANEALRFLRNGPNVEKIEAARAQLAEARGATAVISAQLDTGSIEAPHAGVVTVRHREPNEIVSPGQPVLTIMNPGDRWVRIYIPETKIGAVHLGDGAAIRSDTFPDRRYRGAVTYISPEAEFTPKSVQTTEERVRLVYAVKVRIDADQRLELKPGMPADVTLHSKS